MKPVDSFFGGLRGAFQPDEHAGLLLLIVSVLLLAAAVAVLVRTRWRRARAASVGLRKLIADRRLSIDDVETLEALAAAAGEPTLLLGTRLESFERASAGVLERQPVTLVVRDSDIHARTRRLRQALGFSGLPDHFPLLTTRELAPGTVMDLMGTPATVMDVNEAFLTVRTPGDVVAGAGALLDGVVIRAQDARYDLTLRLLSSRPLEAPPESERGRPPGRILLLAHDEAPTRSQHRGFVRVNARGTVRVRPLASRIGPQPETTETIIGSLVDLSLGGMAVHIPRALSPGVGVAVTFDFAEQSYRDVEALALDCRPISAEKRLLRLAFRKFPPGDEQRLAAAITVVTARPILSEPA
jgi:hypothetical protein